MKRVAAWLLVAVCAVGVAWVGQTLAQDTGQPGRGRQRDPQQLQRMREQISQRIQATLRERLGASEEEWKVLWPRIEKVQQLQGQARGGGARMAAFAGLRDRRGRQGTREAQPAEAQPERQRSEIEKKAEALQKLLDSGSADAATLQAALAEYRQARDKARKELAEAQKQLQELCTVRQEATLVLMGLLE